MTYKCRRCGYVASQKWNMRTHLNRKNSCKPILENISIESLKLELENKYQDIDPSIQKNSRHKCKYCDKTYSKNSGMHRHMKKCKYNVNKVSIKEDVNNVSTKEDVIVDKQQTAKIIELEEKIITLEEKLNLEIKEKKSLVKNMRKLSDQLVKYKYMTLEERNKHKISLENEFGYT